MAGKIFPKGIACASICLMLAMPYMQGQLTQNERKAEVAMLLPTQDRLPAISLPLWS